MDALRCEDCGDTRWSLTGFAPRTAQMMRERCELCDGQMVVERRRPNHGPLHLVHERRTCAVRESAGSR
jgi:hypothetical protein